MKRVRIAFAALLVLGTGLVASLRAETYEEGRVRAATRLFRALLAADVQLDEKTQPDGSLSVVVFFRDDREQAEAVASTLAEAGSNSSDGNAADGQRSIEIRKLQAHIELASDPDLASFGERPPAGIFIAERLDAKTRQKLIQYGIARRIAVCSPFEGDVEAGVLGGVSIEAQVRPLLNRRTLAASHIELKSFFVKVSKVVP